MPSWSTQLARVLDRAPLVVPLQRDVCAAEAQLYVAVKIRPTLVHCLVNGRLWCIVRSDVPITGLADYHQHKLLITVADGNLWVVTLPSELKFGVGVTTPELVLEFSGSSRSSESDGVVQWFGQLPGAQSVEYVPAAAGTSSLTVMRSAVTPSKVIGRNSTSSIGAVKAQQWSLELDELEGEQSTCTLCLPSGDVKYRGLVARLFPEVTNNESAVAILQGDLDGTLRFALVHYPWKQEDVTKASVIRSGVLFKLDQPIQTIVPFASSASSVLSPTGELDVMPQEFDALLALGSRGQIAVAVLSGGDFVESYPISVQKLELGRPVQSLVFVGSLAAFFYCSNGSAYVCRSVNLLKTLVDSSPSRLLKDGCGAFSEKLPLSPGVVRLDVHEDALGISLLFASGRVTIMDKTSLNAMVVSTLTIPEQQGKNAQRETSTDVEVACQLRVRELLRSIAQISAESTALRAQSKQMNCQLESLHSASEILRLIETSGVGSFVKCEMRACVVPIGSFLDRQTIKLTCSLRFANPRAVVSFDHWFLCLHVRIRQQAVTTYSFPLTDSSKNNAEGERSIILDPDTLTLQDQGSVWVSSSLVFSPPRSNRGRMEGKYLKEIPPRDPVSFAIPIQDKRFLLAQLSRPIEEDIPVSQLAIHAGFRQEHEICMPHNGANTDTESPSSALWSGVQWWAALADHAHSNESFAALWAKIAPPDASSLEVSPPSRFVLSIPSFFGDEDDDGDDDEDEDIVKVHVERMVSFLRQMLDVPPRDIAHLRRTCRIRHGKLWTVLRTFSGSLVLLRFAPAEDGRRSVDLTIQCSDVADLSAMRALALEAVSNWKDGAPRAVNEEDVTEELILDVNDILEPIRTLENELEDLTLKRVKNIADPHAAICTDEVLRALSQLARVETQTLTLYWKTRQLLSKTIM